jgi:hypothetical protein
MAYESQIQVLTIFEGVFGKGRGLLGLVKVGGLLK